MPKVTLSPTLFIALEIIILLPSLLFISGFVAWFLFRNTYLYAVVMGGNTLQSIGVLFISPISGGILAYGYLERFKAQGRIAVLSKIILAYSIILIGLIVAYFVSTLLS